MQTRAGDIRPIDETMSRLLFLLDDLKKIRVKTSDHNTEDAVEEAFAWICEIHGRLMAHASTLPGFFGVTLVFIRALYRIANIRLFENALE